jgi:hypothetical protein
MENNNPKDYEDKIYVADFFFTPVALFVQNDGNLVEVQKQSSTTRK